MERYAKMILDFLEILNPIIAILNLVSTKIKARQFEMQPMGSTNMTSKNILNSKFSDHLTADSTVLYSSIPYEFDGTWITI